MIERRSGYRKRYNLELEDIEAMLVEQNGRCRICQKTITFGGRAGAKVDHCHSTGKVRGILCSICNTALGSFKDNTEALARAIKYLRGEI